MRARRRRGRTSGTALGLLSLALLCAASPAAADFECGTAPETCRVHIDNSGRVWFDSNEKLTEDALGDGTLKGGVFQVYERTGKTTRLIKGPDGKPIPPDSHGQSARLLGASSDGARVYISTQAPLAPDDADQVPGDGATDGYELSGGLYTLLTTGPLSEPNAASFFDNGGNVLWASDDGRYVYFETSRRLTADDWDAHRDIYQRAGGQTRLVSTGPDEYLPTPEYPNPAVPESRFLGASPDGATAYFATAAHLTADDPGKSPLEGRLLTSDIFSWRDGATQRITHTVSPEEVPGTPWEAFNSSASAGEGSIYFVANSGQVPEDTDLNPDVYRATPDGALERVIALPPSADPKQNLLWVEAVSRDGARLFLRTGRQLSAADRDNEVDIYMWSAGQFQLITPKGDLREAQEEELHLCSISGDGQRAYFQTWASLSPQDTDSEPDVYEWRNGTVRLVSPASDGRQSAAFCSGISPNGRFVAFSTWEELVPGDTDTKQDIYVIDMGGAGAAQASSSSADAATASRVARRQRGRGAQKRGGQRANRRKRRRLRLVTAEAIAPRMRIARRGVLGKRTAFLRLRCPKKEQTGRCHGKVTLLRKRGRKPLARGYFRIASGRGARVRVRGRRLPARGSARLLVRVKGVDRLGNAKVVSRSVRLRQARSRRR